MSGVLSIENWAIAGRIRSVTSLIPDKIRPGPIFCTMMSRNWAVTFLTWTFLCLKHCIIKGCCIGKKIRSKKYYLQIIYQNASSLITYFISINITFQYCFYQLSWLFVPFCINIRATSLITICTTFLSLFPYTFSLTLFILISLTFLSPFAHFLCHFPSL